PTPRSSWRIGRALGPCSVELLESTGLRRAQRKSCPCPLRPQAPATRNVRRHALRRIDRATLGQFDAVAPHRAGLSYAFDRDRDQSVRAASYRPPCEDRPFEAPEGATVVKEVLT